MLATLAKALVRTALMVHLAVLASMPVQAAEATATAETAEVVIGPETLSMPLDYFVLIRIGPEVGAFRFVSADETDFGRLGTAEYESYVLRKQPRDPDGFLSKKRAGRVRIEQLRGFHPFAWQPGQNVLRVGGWKFRCLAPRLVDLSAGANIQELHIEVALTAITKAEDLDPTAGSLLWYHMDGHSTRHVRIHELVGMPSGGALHP
jgi:hypothetical protein